MDNTGLAHGRTFFSPPMSSSLLTHIPKEKRGWKYFQGLRVGLTRSSSEHWLPTQMTALIGSGNSRRKQIFSLGMRGYLQCWRTHQTHACLEEPTALQHSLHTLSDPEFGVASKCKAGGEKVEQKTWLNQSRAKELMIFPHTFTAIPTFSSQKCI